MVETVFHDILMFYHKQKHDDVINWKHFPRCWPFVWGIPRAPVNSPHKALTRSFDIFFDLRVNKRLNKQIVKLVIWDAIVLTMTSFIMWYLIVKSLVMWAKRCEKGAASYPCKSRKVIILLKYRMKTPECNLPRNIYNRHPIVTPFDVAFVSEV